jgi:hypothetical protein
LVDSNKFLIFVYNQSVILTTKNQEKMKKIKNLLIALFTILTVSSFSQTTFTVTKCSTPNVTCISGDVLKFYVNATSAGVCTFSINGVYSGSVSVTPGMNYIGQHVVTGSDNSFAIYGGGGCSPTFTGSITVTTATGVKDFTMNKTSSLVAFPNPSNGDFKIKFDTNKEKVDLVIYDIQGRLVHQEKPNTIQGENTLDVYTNFASGIYIVKVEDKCFKITVVK